MLDFGGTYAERSLKIAGVDGGTLNIEVDRGSQVSDSGVRWSLLRYHMLGYEGRDRVYGLGDEGALS